MSPRIVLFYTNHRVKKSDKLSSALIKAVMKSQRAEKASFISFARARGFKTQTDWVKLRAEGVVAVVAYNNTSETCVYQVTQEVLEHRIKPFELDVDAELPDGYAFCDCSLLEISGHRLAKLRLEK